ncbi:MAG: hypothetical protein DDT23_01193 [candidate division WS2 bacterium]|nr:hypothetical protein [Candidatus Lithacetigena glycinireducens]
MATERIPGILRITAPVTRYVIQGAIGIGGGMLLSNVVGKTNATIWTVVSGATILVDMLNRFVFRTALGYIGEGEEDLLADENLIAQDAEQVEAFPEEAAVEGLGAFPDELAAFPYEQSPVY